MPGIKHSREANMEPLKFPVRQKSRENIPGTSVEKRGKSPGSSMIESTKQLSSKTRRPKRVSQVPNQQSGHSLHPGRRLSSASACMEPSGYGNCDMDSRSGSASREIDLNDSSVRLTPITGRISRAKKGQPVHICTRCDVPRLFSRAEHLRRHELSHDKPLYRCTFEECEKKFHRPDLLARHINCHETRGEKLNESCDDQIRSPTSPVESQSPGWQGEPILASNAPDIRLSSERQPISPEISRRSGSATTDVFCDGMMVDCVGDLSSDTSTRPSIAPQEFPGSPSLQVGPIVVDGYTSVGPRNFSPYEDDAVINAGRRNFIQNRGQGFFNDMYHNVPQDDRQLASHPLLTVRVPDLIQSPWTPTDSTWSTPSDVSRPGAVWQADRPTSYSTHDAWAGNPMATSPQSSNGNPRRRSSMDLEIVEDRIDSPTYLSPHLSPPLVSYHDGDVPPFEGSLHGDFVGIQPISGMMKYEEESCTRIPTSSRRPLPMNEGRSDTLIHVEDSNVPQISFLSFLDEKTIRNYVGSYRVHVDHVFPVLHPVTSYGLGFSAILKNAVAALGSQFCNNPDDRRHGVQLNEVCTRMVNHPTDWSIQVMQGIFLVELFRRFRSPKVIRHPSRQFRELCDELFDDQSLQNDAGSLFARLNWRKIRDCIFNQSAEDLAGGREQCLDELWRDWIEYETRQRLRSACFVFDTHQARYYEQDRERPDVNDDDTFLVFPCHEALWAAQSGSEWFERVHELNCSDVQSNRPLNVSIEQCESLPLSGQLLILSCLMARLPPRGTISTPSTNSKLYEEAYATIRTLFPNSLASHAHLALYHTPLHDVLAFTGESWAFGRKITSSNEWATIKERVLRWRRSPLASRATWHACHVIRLFISRGTITGDSVTYMNVSDYWAAYTAAIICWIFGQASPQRQRHHRSLPIPKATSSSGNSSFSNLNSFNCPTSPDEIHEMRDAALRYTEGMLSVEPMELSTAQMRPATSRMLAAVRWKLEIDVSEGESRCAMLVDACNVLDRILESGK